MARSDSDDAGRSLLARREFLLAVAGCCAVGPAGIAAPPPVSKLRWTITDAGDVLGHSPDSKSLFTQSTEKGEAALAVWDLKTGTKVRTHRLPVSKAQKAKPYGGFCEDLAGGRYYACEYKGKLLAIDLKTGEEWRHDLSADDEVRYLRMSPTGNYIQRFDGYWVSLLIETRTGKIVHQIGEKEQRPGRAFVYGKVDGAEFTPDGRYFVYHFRDTGGPFLEVWDAGGRKVLRRLGVYGSSGGLACPVVTAGSQFVLAPTRVPGGGPDPPDPKPGDRAPGRYTVWSLPELKERCTISWQTAGPRGQDPVPLVFSPGGRRVAAWPGGDGVQFWDLEAGKHLGTVRFQPGAGNSAVFWSPAGTRVAVFRPDDPSIRVFHAERAREVWSRDSDAGYTQPYFSADSRRLAVSTGNGVSFLDADPGTETTVVSAVDKAGDLRPTPDGRFLWFADSRPDRDRGPDADGGFTPIITWRVLNRNTGREVLRVEAHKDWLGAPRRSQFLAPGGGRTVVQIEETDEPRSCDLLCWKVTEG